jgi:hypothetical protein
MKYILIILSQLLLVLGANAQAVTVDQLRKEYYKASSDSITCSKLHSKLQNENSSDNLVMGYKGAVSAAMANHVKNKSEKLKLFNGGKKLIEQSLSADKNNVELRFLRFTIQTNCPKALGYNEQIPSDKKFILENLDNVKSASLRKKMTSFLVSSPHVTEEEKQALRSDK